MQTDDVVQQLTEAASGLLMMSETDAPLEPVRLDGARARSNEDAAKQLVDLADGASVETVSVDHFFRNAVVERPTDTAEMRATSARFRTLVETIHRLLPDAQVIRIGEVNVNAVLLGRSEAGDWVGLRTELVET